MFGENLNNLCKSVSISISFRFVRFLLMLNAGAEEFIYYLLVIMVCGFNAVLLFCCSDFYDNNRKHV